MNNLDKLIEECEQKAARATQGEWKFERIAWEDGKFTYEINDGNRLLVISEMNYNAPMKAKFDAEHIANAVNSQATLIACLKVAVEALEYYSKQSTGIRSNSPGIKYEFGCGCCSGTIDQNGELDFDKSVVGSTAREALARINEICK